MRPGLVAIALDDPTRWFEVSHRLKTWPDVFRQVVDGTKTHEFRKNDRHFKVDDVLLLEEFDAAGERYSGRSVLVAVTSISYGPEWGIPEGYAAFSIRDLGRFRIVEAGR